MPNKNRGFTLIELLVVVTILGILAGLLIIIIDPQKQRQRALDGVRVGNVAKIAQAVEAFNAAEGHYPNKTQDCPTCADDEETLKNSNYINQWPADCDSCGDELGYNYRYLCEFGQCTACVSVVQANAPDTTRNYYFKYISTFSQYTGSPSEEIFAGRVVKNCEKGCAYAATSQANDLINCEII